LYSIIIKVDSKEGEESLWFSYISEEELIEMGPLINEIIKNGGYFPTGSYIGNDDPRPDVLYSGLPGWKILTSRLPTPLSGFKKILEIHVFKDNPNSLYM